MKNSRTKNSAFNILTSIASQIVTIVLSFISRTVFLKVLGVGYLGISGLFGDVLSMLTLADLGFGTAMMFSMYKPLAENDQETLAGLICFYKKVYRIIALGVTLIGLALIPFLPYLINLQTDIPHVTLYYILFLANTVASYLVVYKTTILAADQKSYILTKYTMIINVIQTLVQIVVLLLTHNYIIYLLTQVLFVYGTNFYKSQVAQKMYPYINKKVVLPKERTKDIFKNISSVFLYKLSSVMINATDNTLISIIVGTEWVGYYSNYGIIISKLTGIINTVFYSLTASLGNLIVKENYNKRYSIFQIMQAVSQIISTFCVTCVFFLEEDFVRIWLGNEYALGKLVLCAITLNFYFSITLLPIWVFRESTGLYRKTKYVMLCTAGVNLLTSIYLGNRIGLAGVIFATSIARFTTYFWYEPYLLFKEYFNKSCKYFFSSVLKGIIGTGVTFIVVYFASIRLNPVTWIQLLIKGIVVGFISLLMSILIYHRTEGFRLMYQRVKEIFERIEKAIRK